MIQLVYASAATAPFTPDALKALLAKARMRNTTYGVSGMLLYHEGSFLQVLEGEPTHIDLIYHSIARDPRHRSPKVLFKSEIARREFPDWSMGYVDTTAWPSRAPGHVDYLRLPEPASNVPTAARKYLRLFQQGLCRQALAA